MLQRSDIQCVSCVEEKSQLNKLIRCRISGEALYCSFKGGNFAFFENEANWNFIQSLTKLCVKGIFDILKGT